VQQIEVEFLKTQNIDFAKMDFGKIVEKISPTHFLIESTVSDDIRAKIFDFAVANNLKILTLHEKEQHLEEIFREITLEKLEVRS
jgi:hypothetical protein